MFVRLLQATTITLSLYALLGLNELPAGNASNTADSSAETAEALVAIKSAETAEALVALLIRDR